MHAVGIVYAPWNSEAQDFANYTFSKLKQCIYIVLTEARFEE